MISYSRVFLWFSSFFRIYANQSTYYCSGIGLGIFFKRNSYHKYNKMFLIHLIWLLEMQFWNQLARNICNVSGYCSINGYFYSCSLKVKRAQIKDRLFFISNIVPKVPDLNLGEKLNNLLSNRKGLNYKSTFCIFPLPKQWITEIYVS